MDDQYLFSIVIPTYNRADVLQRCLNSLVAQTYKKFEVLVCDDGSTDHTKNIVENFKEKLTLKYFCIQNTGGPATPRNIGIREARGEWICFLDSDDWYVENRLEIISKLRLDEFDFLYHDLSIIKNEKKYKITTSRILSKKNPYRDLLCNLNTILASSTCVRKSFLLETNGFCENKEIIGVEDFHLWIRIAKLKARFKYLPEVLGFYFIGNDNLTLHDHKQQINRVKALYTEFINEEGNVAFKNKIIAALNYNIGSSLVKNSEFRKAFRPLFRSLVYGSIPIKLRLLNINMFLEGIKYLRIKGSFKS